MLPKLLKAGIAMYGSDPDTWKDYVPENNLLERPETVQIDLDAMGATAGEPTFVGSSTEI